MQPSRWCHMHHSCYAFNSLDARLRNLNPTWFHTKQAARSWRVSHTVFILPSILWHTRQTIARLVLRHKPILKSPNRSCWFWRPNRKTWSHRFWSQTRRNHRHRFWAQTINKPSWWFWGQTTDKLSTLVLRLNQETRTPRLLVHGVNRTQCHPTSRSSGQRVSDLCDHPRSSALDLLLLPRFSSLPTMPHLNITRQANTILQMKQR
jgi:hypothetical protein